MADSSRDDFEREKARNELRICGKKDECLIWDNVAESLTAEIRHGIAQAASKYQTCLEANNAAWQVFNEACDEKDMRSKSEEHSWKKYDALFQDHIEAVHQGAVYQDQYQEYMEAQSELQSAQRAVQEAHDKVEEAQNVLEQVQADDLRCYHEKTAREHLGEMAINALQRAHSDMRAIIWRDIQSALDRQHKRGGMGAQGPWTR